MTRSFGGMFGRSMFSPVLEHVDKAMDCMESLQELVRRFSEGDYEALKTLSQRIAKLEHDADVIKVEFRDSFSKSLFAVVDRSEMLSLIKAQDGISDECEDIAKLMSIRQTAITPELKGVLLELVGKAYESVKALREVEEYIVHNSSADPEKLEEMLKTIHVKEWEADQLQLRFTKLLFEQEKSIDVVSLFLLRDLIHMIGKIANHAENVGDSIRRIVVR